MITLQIKYLNSMLIVCDKQMLISVINHLERKNFCFAKDYWTIQDLDVLRYLSGKYDNNLYAAHFPRFWNNIKIK